MRVYWRLGRQIGVSMPWWLAAIVGLFWLAGLMVVAAVAVLIGAGWLLLQGCVLAWKLGRVLVEGWIGLVRGLRAGR